MDIFVAKLWPKAGVRLICHTLIALLCGMALFSIFVPRANDPVLSNTPFNQLDCTDTMHFESDQTRPILTILIPAHTMAQKTLMQFCTNTLILHHYSNIKVVWQARHLLSPKMLYQHHFDIMWERDYRLSGLIPNYQDHYRPLVTLPTYSAYWYSMHHTFTPSGDYFQQHNIGLLADRYSLSGYQLPLRELAKFGLDEQAPQIRLYASRRELVNALISGQVDVIADSNYSSINQEGSSITHAVIERNLSSGAWFISNQVTDKSITDAIHQQLLTLTAS